MSYNGNINCVVETLDSTLPNSKFDKRNLDYKHRIVRDKDSGVRNISATQLVARKLPISDSIIQFTKPDSAVPRVVKKISSSSKQYPLMVKSRKDLQYLPHNWRIPKKKSHYIFCNSLAKHNPLTKNNVPEIDKNEIISLSAQKKDNLLSEIDRSKFCKAVQGIELPDSVKSQAANQSPHLDNIAKQIVSSLVSHKNIAHEMKSTGIYSASKSLIRSKWSDNSGLMAQNFYFKKCPEKSKESHKISSSTSIKVNKVKVQKQRFDKTFKDGESVKNQKTDIEEFSDNESNSDFEKFILEHRNKTTVKFIPKMLLDSGAEDCEKKIKKKKVHLKRKKLKEINHKKQEKRKQIYKQKLVDQSAFSHCKMVSGSFKHKSKNYIKAKYKVKCLSDSANKIKMVLNKEFLNPKKFKNVWQNDLSKCFVSLKRNLFLDHLAKSSILSVKVSVDNCDKDNMTKDTLTETSYKNSVSVSQSGSQIKETFDEPSISTTVSDKNDETSVISIKLSDEDRCFESVYETSESNIKIADVFSIHTCETFPCFSNDEKSKKIDNSNLNDSVKFTKKSVQFKTHDPNFTSRRNISDLGSEEKVNYLNNCSNHLTRANSIDEEAFTISDRDSDVEFIGAENKPCKTKKSCAKSAADTQALKKPSTSLVSLNLEMDIRNGSKSSASIYEEGSSLPKQSNTNNDLAVVESESSVCGNCCDEVPNVKVDVVLHHNNKNQKNIYDGIEGSVGDQTALVKNTVGNKFVIPNTHEASVSVNELSDIVKQCSCEDKSGNMQLESLNVSKEITSNSTKLVDCIESQLKTSTIKSLPSEECDKNLRKWVNQLDNDQNLTHSDSLKCNSLVLNVINTKETMPRKESQKQNSFAGFKGTVELCASNEDINKMESCSVDDILTETMLTSAKSANKNKCELSNESLLFDKSDESAIDNKMRLSQVSCHDKESCKQEIKIAEYEPSNLDVNASERKINKSKLLSHSPNTTGTAPNNSGYQMLDEQKAISFDAGNDIFMSTNELCQKYFSDSKEEKKKIFDSPENELDALSEANILELSFDKHPNILPLLDLYKIEFSHFQEMIKAEFIAGSNPKIELQVKKLKHLASSLQNVVRQDPCFLKLWNDFQCHSKDYKKKSSFNSKRFIPPVIKEVEVPTQTEPKKLSRPNTGHLISPFLYGSKSPNIQKNNETNIPSITVASSSPFITENQMALDYQINETPFNYVSKPNISCATVIQPISGYDGNSSSFPVENSRFHPLNVSESTGWNSNKCISLNSVNFSPSSCRFAEKDNSSEFSENYASFSNSAFPSSSNSALPSSNSAFPSSNSAFPSSNVIKELISWSQEKYVSSAPMGMPNNFPYPHQNPCWNDIRNEVLLNVNSSARTYRPYVTEPQSLTVGINAVENLPMISAHTSTSQNIYSNQNFPSNTTGSSRNSFTSVVGNQYIRNSNNSSNITPQNLNPSAYLTHLYQQQLLNYNSKLSLNHEFSSLRGYPTSNIPNRWVPSEMYYSKHELQMQTAAINQHMGLNQPACVSQNSISMSRSSLSNSSYASTSYSGSALGNSND